MSIQEVFYAHLFSYIANFTGEGQWADLTLNLLSEMSSCILDLTQNLSGAQTCITWWTQGSTSCRYERIWFGILYFKQFHAAEEFL